MIFRSSAAATPDVEGRPDLFRLARDGRPTALTGCPPDAFARDGQLWGHPTTAGPPTERSPSAGGRRVATTLDRFDLVRVDHHRFRPGLRGAGRREERPERSMGSHPRTGVVDAASEGPGNASFIAEDLGDVTPAVHRLRDDFSCPACGSCSGRSTTPKAGPGTFRTIILVTRWSIQAPTTMTPRSDGSSRFRRRSAADSPTTRAPTPRPIPRRP